MEVVADEGWKKGRGGVSEVDWVKGGLVGEGEGMEGVGGR